MATMDARHDVGGNYLQPEDGRDERGQLPEPLDVKHYPIDAEHPDVILLPGMAPSQRKGASVEDASLVPGALTPKEQHELNVSEKNLSTKAEQGKGVAPNADAQDLGHARAGSGSKREADSYAKKAEAKVAETKATDAKTATGAAADKPATARPTASK